MLDKYYRLEDITVRFFLISLAVLMGAAPVSAETYKWIDDRGTVNFTEDYSQIPKKYRKKARLIGDVGASSPVDTSGSAEESKKDQSGRVPAENSKALSAGKQEKKSIAYGGKSRDEWSGEFRKINNDMQSMQEQITARRDRLSHPEKLTRTQYLGTQYEIKDMETKLEELKNKLSDLDEAASRAGVPYDLRK